MSSSHSKTKNPPSLTQIVIDELPDLFYCNLSDEAASHIAEFLSNLAFIFEGTRFAQIHRYHRSMIPDPPPPDPGQLDLFTDLPPV
jgi:hypothetical protein